VSRRLPPRRRLTRPQWAISVGLGLAVIGFVGAAQWNSSLARTEFITSAQRVLISEAEQVQRQQETLRAEIEAEGGDAHVVELDVTDHASIKAAVAHTETEMGTIDILVNNSGVATTQRLTEVTAEDYDFVFDTNTKGAFFVAQEVGKRMLARAQGSAPGTYIGGRIINIASDASKRAKPMTAAYTSSKFAVVGLTQAAALDLAPHQITVNAVCPGTVNTDRLNYWEQAQARAQRVPPEEFRAHIVANSAKATPLGRVAESEDVANLVAFLASEEANFITGQAYNINGGVLFH
jgi:NAD(P)-dependent dehydrogenase (short-subunit alcohol dehydrogenase family)